jgi:dihydrodipicolinate synthase/N-acetylneuraminate lyase
MLSSKDLGGLMAMMPAFATDNAADIKATNTVDVDRLHKGLDRMIRDGADVIATMGSFGECHTLLPDEFRTMTYECIAVNKKRVPLMIGVTSVNSREALAKIRIADEAGADAILLGVPYYFPSSLDNAIRLYREVSEMFPKLGIMLYHNPALHHVRLTLEVFEQLVKLPNVIGMKDSHRETLEFMKLQKIIKGKIAHFCAQYQYYPYCELGASGFWSIDAWMGPWPQLALRDAVKRGDFKAAQDIILDIVPAGTVKADLSWRETASKIGVKLAGYVDPGPLRPPFLDIPPEVIEKQKKRVESWKKICEKYRQKAAAAE